MFKNNLFLNVPQKADLSVTVREASKAWQNGVFTWNAWIKEFLAHQQNITEKLNGSEKSYHICLTLAENIFSCRYETEIISPEMKDVTVCRCAERRSAKKLIPAFA